MAVNPDVQVVINNRFGKVNCFNWDKNTVQIEVTITVTASGQKEAEKKFSKINIDINGTPASVTGTTTLEEIKNSINDNFAIDYQVNLPVTANLDVTNKFGDIFINEIQGKAKITLGYGNFDAKKLGNSDNLLDLKFSKGKMNWAKGAVLTMKYSSMKIDYAGSLRLDSKFSDLDAEKIIALNVVFEGGKLEMENSAAVDSKSRFSDIDIGRIDQSLNLDIQYGNCEIHEMPADFTSVMIRNKYADVTVGLASQARYSLEADLKFCDLDYPENKAKFSYRSVTSTEKNYKGVIGGGETPQSKVVIKSEFGDVSLK